MNVLVTGAGGAGARGVFRSLSLCPDYRLFGIDCAKYLVPHDVKEITIELEFPRADSPKYEATILNLLDRWEIDVILPQPDAERYKLQAFEHTSLPSPEFMKLCDDKKMLIELWNAAGLRSGVLLEYIPEAKETRVCSLPQAIKGFWVRGRKGAGGKGALLITLPQHTEKCLADAIQQFSSWARLMHLLGIEVHAEEWFTGRDFSYCSVWKNGVPQAESILERLEMGLSALTPTGKTGIAYVLAVFAPQHPFFKPSVQYARETVQAIAGDKLEDVNGPIAVDFREDDRGILRPTEINAGRLLASQHATTAAGVNLPQVLCELVTDPDRRYDPPATPTDLTVYYRAPDERPFWETYTSVWKFNRQRDRLREANYDRVVQKPWTPLPNLVVA